MATKLGASDDNDGRLRAWNCRFAVTSRKRLCDARQWRNLAPGNSDESPARACTEGSADHFRTYQYDHAQVVSAGCNGRNRQECRRSGIPDRGQDGDSRKTRRQGIFEDQECFDFRRRLPDGRPALCCDRNARFAQRKCKIPLGRQRPPILQLQSSPRSLRGLARCSAYSRMRAAKLILQT